MWGLESIFQKREKAKNSENLEGDMPATPIAPEAVAEADAVITKAKKRDGVPAEDRYNPNQYGGEISIGPRTEARKSMPVSENGVDDLRINPDLLEAALENPTALGGPAKKRASANAALQAESFYVDPKQVEAALVSGQLPDALPIKKAPRRPDTFVAPRAPARSSTPMGTLDDLRTAGKGEGVEDDWKAAQRAARVNNPEGIKSFRTPKGAADVEDHWKAAKRAVEGSKSVEGLGVFRTAPKDLTTKREMAGVGLTEQRKVELRQNAERLVLQLRKMIDTESDETERKSMQARLAMAEKFYDEQFKDGARKEDRFSL